MRTKLKEDTEFKEYKLYDPVKLLLKIKETCLTYRGNKNQYAVTLNAILGVASLKQQDGEHIKTDAERVKSRVESLFRKI